MPTERTSRSSRERVRAHRARLRAQGLKPVTFWLPDVNSPEFREEARRQCAQLDQSDDEKEVLALLDSLYDDWLAMIEDEERACREGR